MSSIADVFDRLDEALAALDAVDWDGLSMTELFEGMSRLETARRRAAARACDTAAAVDRRGEQALDGISHRIIADVLRVSPGEARRRIRDANQLAPRTTLTGQPVAAELAATAIPWNAGLLDTEHLRVIQRFIRELPGHVAPVSASQAEAFLAEQAALLRPDQLEKVAGQLGPAAQPRRDLLRRRPGPQTRVHLVRGTGAGRDERCQVDRDAGVAGHDRGLDGQVRRPGDLQP